MKISNVEISFQSLTIGARSIRPHIALVNAVSSFPVPYDKRSFHQFVGLVNYNHWFPPMCAEMLDPLHQALGTDSFNRTTACQEAFDKAKQSPSEALMLVDPHPNAAPCIRTDASNHAVRAAFRRFTDSLKDTGNLSPFFPRNAAPWNSTTVSLIKNN